MTKKHGVVFQHTTKHGTITLAKGITRADVRSAKPKSSKVSRVHVYDANPMAGLSHRLLRRLALSNGIPILTKDGGQALRDISEYHVMDVLNKAMLYCWHSRHSTVDVAHIGRALQLIEGKGQQFCKGKNSSSRSSHKKEKKKPKHHSSNKKKPTI